MRKIIRKISLAMAVLSVFAVFGSACHSHSFTAKVTTDAYLKSEATCTEGKLYYYSCECGEKGEETALKEEKDTEKSKKCALCQEIKLTKKQKNVLIGAGVAAATLGLAYLVGKFTKD